MDCRSRSDVSRLIRQLREAVRRPLFTEIALDESMDANRPQPIEAVAATRPEPEVPRPPPSSQLMARDVMSETDSQGPFSTHSSSLKRPPLPAGSPLKKTWKELLKDASQLLPYMTEREHGEISKLAAILLLGFLLPHSTGNEYFLTQHIPVDRESVTSLSEESNSNNNNNNKSNIENLLDYILHMELEERLESCCRHYSANEFGEFETLSDATWELAMDSFLKEGLAPFLGGRPAHLEQVDLIHLLAMIVHPQPNDSYIHQTASSLEDRVFWQRAKKLMNNRHAYSFHVNYRHRLKIVKLIVQDLVVPRYDPNLPMVNSPLFDGALPHLRASLHAFSRSAMSMDDGHWSRCAQVAIAIQSQRDMVLKEEWEHLLNRMVDDRTQYPGCKYCPHQLRMQRFGFYKKQTERAEPDACFCPHAGRGLHLAEFLIRTCQARHYAGCEFLEEAFSSLTDAIEWQMHCWRQPKKQKAKNSEEPTCLLTSLLFAAKTFFYFLLPLEERKTDDDGDNFSDAIARRDDLINCAIQLVHHWDATIASEASQLVALAFAYGPKKSIEEYARPLFASLRKSITIEPNQENSEASENKALHWEKLSSSYVSNVVAAASRLSPGFALSFLNFLLKRLEALNDSDTDHTASVWESTSDGNGDASMEDADDKETTDETAKQTAYNRIHQVRFLMQLVAAISLSNPVVAAEQVQRFAQLLEKSKDVTSRCHLIAAMLACRQSRFFAESKENVTDTTIRKAMLQMNDRWSLYQMARHALRTGNFAMANQFYGQILESSLSEHSLLWISALAKVSEAELCLSKTAARGIPIATTALQSAHSIFQSLNALDQSPDSNFVFQISLVCLRLDFLDLLTSLRQLIREMRLTGTGPAKRTRSFLHFQNTVKCFDALARRYWSLYRKYGLFICQQSRTSLRSLHALCRFVARSIRVVFADTSPSFTTKKLDTWPGTGCAGDRTFPIARFIQRLDEQLLQQMSASIDPVIRAATMLEVIDGIVLCPVPIPKDFLNVISVPSGTLRLTADPDQSDEDAIDGEPHDDLRSIECYPGVSFTFYAAGEIPSSFIAKSNLPFSTLLLRHRAMYEHPLPEQDEDHMADEKQEDDFPVSNSDSKVIPRPWNYILVSSRLFTNGKYIFAVECPPIREEGVYLIEVQFGCRDIRGGEWEIPVSEASKTIQVHVSRSG